MVSLKVLITSVLAANAVAIGPDVVVTNIQALTMKSSMLRQPAGELTLVNAPLLVIGQGPLPKVIFGFADIVTTAGKAFVQMQGMEKVMPGDASDAIFDAFREFVKVHQALLNILIGKAGLFTTVPFIGAPVAAVLRQIEMFVDTLANSLIDTLQGRGPEVKEQGGMLMGTVEKGIQSYQGLQLSGDQSMGSSMMMGSDMSGPLGQTVGSVTGSLKGPLTGLLMPDKASGMGEDSGMMGGDSKSGDSSMMSSSSSSGMSDMRSSSSPMPSIESGISLCSGDDTPKGVLKPITDPLQGGGPMSQGGGSSSMPAKKRALAFAA